MLHTTLFEPDNFKLSDLASTSIKSIGQGVICFQYLAKVANKRALRGSYEKGS